MSRNSCGATRHPCDKKTKRKRKREERIKMTGVCMQLVLPLYMMFLNVHCILADTWTREDIIKHSTGSCFNQSQKYLRMSCDAGHMVKLDRVYYGHSAGDQCVYSEDDCTLDVPKEEHYPCIGQQVCDINLPSGGFGPHMPKCQAYSTYMQVMYECIPEEEITDICQKAVIRHKQWGYIKTPLYPTNYPMSKVCNLTVVAPHASQTIKVYIIDLNLENNGTDCVDWLHLHDNFRSYTLCNLRARRHVWTTTANVLKLTFHSNYENRRKGFWLHYEATPYIEPPTAVPTTTTEAVTTTAAPTNKTGSHLSENSTGGDTVGGEHIHHVGDHHYHITYRNESSFPIGIVIGVVIGAVVCIMLVLVIVVVIKRREAAKVPVSISCTSTTAFLEAKQAEAPPGVKCINNDLKADRAPSYQEATAGSHGDAITPYIEQQQTAAPPYHREAKIPSYCEAQAPPYSVTKPTYNEAVQKPVSQTPQHKDKVVTLEDYNLDDRSPYIDVNMRTGEEQLYC